MKPLLSTANLVVFALLQGVVYKIFSAPIENRDDYKGSLDDLLADFRREQVYLSNTMLNTSRSLQLPEKLAAAEVEEAEERKARAFRGKSEAKTPFIATNSMFSLGYIGRGYDIYFGNPLSDDGVVDQGFRLPVIDLPFSFRFTSDGEYRIPDNVDVISEPSASFGSSYFQVKSESDYQSMLKVDVSVNAHGSGWGLSGSFSASASYQKSQREIQKGETTNLNVVGRAVVYKARLSSTAKVSKVSDYFESAVKSLPVDHCEESSMQELYRQVIEEFGTHYTTEVVMGAKAVQELKYRNSDLDKLSAEGISAKVAAELSYSGFGASVGGGFSAGFENTENQRKRVSNTNKEQREYYIGGSPPSGDISKGSTESLREWARSASENPVPIQYKLASIDSLIKPDYFKHLTNGFYERRKCLRKALLSYCMGAINPHFCNTRNENVRRRKRDTDMEYIDTEVPTVRYGDFVKLRNRYRFLVLSKNYGMVTGTAVKMLTSASQISNYDGLFQILPLESQENKMQSVIRYGEPFTLGTKEGEQLYMGRRFISNTDSPSEARLMDLFKDTNEKRTVNHSRTDIEDFAVFLKRSDLRTYLVSLLVETYCSGNRNYTRVFQVEMNGEDGTITAFVTASCTCSYRACSYKSWFHSLIVEKDIKRILNVQLIGMYGGATDPVKGVQIKTIINGRKQRIINDGPLQCTGRNYVIPRLISPETSYVDLDIYPTQFAFHAKQKQQNQPVTVGESGYIHILSSFPKRKFWGQDVSHLLRIDSMEMIGIKEEGPRQHKTLPADCSGLIYPTIGGLAKRHDLSDRLVISFDVTVMMNYIEIETENASSLNVAYIDRRTDKFVEVTDSDFKEEPSSLNTNMKTFKLTLKKTIYTTAVKIYLQNSNNQNLTSIIKMLAIGGCLSALIETGYENTEDQEWQIDVSENEIQNYPFLQVVPKINEKLDPNEVYRNLETPVSSLFTVTVPIEADKIDCSFDGEFIRNYLTTTTSGLKFDKVILERSASVDDEGQMDLKIQIFVTGLTQEEFDKGALYLNDTLKTAIAIYPCRAETPKSAAQTVQYTNTDQTTIMAVVAITCSCLVFALLVIIGYLIYHLHVKSKLFKDKQDRRIVIKLKESHSDINNDRTPGETFYENDDTTDQRKGIPFYQNGETFEDNHRQAMTMYQNDEAFQDNQIFASRTDLDAERVSKNDSSVSIDRYLNEKNIKQRNTMNRLSS